MDKITKLYNALVQSGYNMAPEDVFRQRLDDPAKRRAAYDAMVKSGYNMRPYDEFEVNIGYGAATAAPSADGSSQSPSAGGIFPGESPAPSAPTVNYGEGAWHPSTQDKIRLSALGSRIRQSGEGMKASADNFSRRADAQTQGGRDRLKMARQKARMAGAPTRPVAVSPYVSTDDREADAEGQPDAPRPIVSRQSPVPHGVRYVDGKAVTEWLMPDGSLTTDLTEAGMAEYAARDARLRDEFVGRMRRNGLDPAKGEDVFMQSVYDESGLPQTVAALWRDAEKAHKEDTDKVADREWGNYLDTGMGKEGRVMATGGMAHGNQVSHMRRYDLEKMMEETWKRTGEQVTLSYLRALVAENPSGDPTELRQQAEEMARSVTDNAVYQYAVGKNTPKSTLEVFGRTAADMNVIGSLTKGLARVSAGSTGDLPAREAANAAAGEAHPWANIGGTVVGMAIDPVTYYSGFMGNLMGRAAAWAGARFLPGFGSTFGGRMAIGMAAGMGNLATYEATKEAERQFVHGGHVNEEGVNVGYSGKEIAKAGGRGAGLGLFTGAVTPLVGAAADPAVKAASSTGGKMAVRAGELGASKVLEGTIFAAPDIYGVYDMSDEEFDEYNAKKFGYADIDDEQKKAEARKAARQALSIDAWNGSMAMMMGFGASHAIKSAPHVVASLRPVKAAPGRPLTAAELRHNQMSFVERVRKALDPAELTSLTRADSPARVSEALRLTSSERAELRRAGYGGLAELFTRDKAPAAHSAEYQRGLEATKGRAAAFDNISLDEEITELEGQEAELTEYGLGMLGAYKAEARRRLGIDGYSEMERLMNDKSVSQAVRAKLYTTLTGRRLPAATITSWTTDKGDDGRITVRSLSAGGEVVTARTFSSEIGAAHEADAIRRQAELNNVMIGEAKSESRANEKVLHAAIEEVVPGCDPKRAEKIYMRVRLGSPDVNVMEMELADNIDKAIERHLHAYDHLRPEAIRADLADGYDMDVEEVLRKSPLSRTEKEQDLVDHYLRLLHPEEEAPEPIPEQTQAQAAYDEGREFYERHAGGDDGAMSDMDAIIVRAKEAEDLFSEAFPENTEACRSLLEENPWALLSDPRLTADQADAVLYWINSRAALDGVMDASQEAAERKRAEVEQSVSKRTHKDTGAIIPATMKVDDRQVYIVKGDVVMFPDGSGVDSHNSSESVVVMDAESGEYEFTSPDQIFKVGERIDPEEEKRAALEAIGRETNAIFGEERQAYGGENGMPSGEPGGETAEGTGDRIERLPGVGEIIAPWMSVEEANAIIAGGEPSLRSDHNGGQEQDKALTEGEKSVTSQYGNGSEQNNGIRTGAEGSDSGGRVADDTASAVEGDRDRSDIRVYEEGLGAPRDEHSEYSERNRREAESERLVRIAKEQGQYRTRKDVLSLGKRHDKGTGESEVVIDHANKRVYKIKNPYAKSPMKGNVQPEDAIYEHLVHNKYFPETRYTFEGISDDIGDVRIVLSQEYVESAGRPTQQQITAALAEKGLHPEDKYTFGNDEVSVTDVTGDNALQGADGKVFFIDPIINFKKPVREIIEGRYLEANTGEGTAVPGEPMALSRIPRDERGKARFTAA